MFLKVCIEYPHLVKTDMELLESKIIHAVINYIQLLINETKPSKTIYIEIDGVALMAKIKHQTIRRFKSVYDRKQIENIYKKHGSTYPKEWNTSVITPGTIFMDKLTVALMNWIKTTDFGAKVIFSSSYTPG